MLRGSCKRHSSKVACPIVCPGNDRSTSVVREHQVYIEVFYFKELVHAEVFGDSEDSLLCCTRTITRLREVSKWRLVQANQLPPESALPFPQRDISRLTEFISPML